MSERYGRTVSTSLPVPGTAHDPVRGPAAPDSEWPLVTDRLSLRPVVVGDAEAFLRWRSRPDLVQYMYQPPWDREAAEAKLHTWGERAVRGRG